MLERAGLEDATFTRITSDYSKHIKKYDGPASLSCCMDDCWLTDFYRYRKPEAS